MKKLCLFALVVAAMASCSENEVMQDGAQKAISFNNVQWGNNIVSRAAVDNGVKLGVFAYQTKADATGLYIDNAVLAHNGTKWALDNTYYWPKENPEMKFFAYGPQDAAGITKETCTVKGTPTFSYAIADAAAAATDVIVDMDGKTSSSTAVTFALKHVLTQVIFKVQLSDPYNEKLVTMIKSIKVQSPGAADFTIDTNAAKWLNYAGTNTDYTVAENKTVNAKNGTAEPLGTPLNFIPGSGSKIIVDAMVVQGGSTIGEKSIVITCDGVTETNHVAAWAAGTQVTYTITLDPDAIATDDSDGQKGTAIGFGDPTIADWGTGSGSIDL